MHSASTVARARKMRSGGLALKEIARRLNISKGTASLWLRDMPLDPKVVAERQRAAAEQTGVGVWAHKAALDRTAKWRAEALTLWKDRKGEPHFLFGIGLYWGEGSKTGKVFVLSNSDPALMRCWVAWCARYMSEVEYEVRVIVRADVDPERARSYWRRVTGQRVASYVGIVPSKNGPTVKAIYGTAHMHACRGAAECYVKMMAWLELLKTYKF